MFYERKRSKGKKLYSDYALVDTIAISSKDNDDCDMAKRLRSNALSPMAFTGLIRVKLEVLIVVEANEPRAREGEHRLQMEMAFPEESSIKKEVAQLKSLFFNWDREKTPFQID